MNNSVARQKSFIIACLVIPVLGCFYAGLAIMMWFRYPQGLPRNEIGVHMVHFSIVYVMWLIVFFVFNLFEPRVLQQKLMRYGSLLGAMIVSLVVAVLYFYAQPELILTPRRFLLGHAGISVALVALWYELIRYLSFRQTRQIVYSIGLLPEMFDELIKVHAYLGLRYQGELPRGGENRPANPLIVLPGRESFTPETIQVLYAWRTAGATVLPYHDFYELLNRRISLETLGELWFVEHVQYQNRRPYWLAKRAVDIIVGLVGMLVGLLTFPIIALIIKLTSPGPIFFIQKRVGQYGKSFKLYKYRTMSGGLTNVWTTERDTRITRVGKWLRKLRIDELPQCINILKGDMSIVGPRPEQVHIVEQLRERIPYYDERHIVKPGLTGWAQLHVYAGNIEETKLKLQYDLYYVKHRSILFDLEIILKTLYHILTFGGR